MNTILVADDSSTIQKVVRINLANEPYKVRECMDEEEMVGLIKANSFDLVLLDFNLSNTKTGYELGQSIKEVSPNTKIIAMLGTFDVVDEDQLLEVGFIDSIVKPFESALFLSKCRDAFAAAPGDEVNDVFTEQEQTTEEPQTEEETVEDNLADWSIDSSNVSMGEAIIPEPIIDNEISIPEPISNNLSQEMEDWGMEIPQVIGASSESEDVLLPPVIESESSLEDMDLPVMKHSDEEEVEPEFDIDSTSTFDLEVFENTKDQELPEDSDLDYPDLGEPQETESEEDLADPLADPALGMVSMDSLAPDNSGIEDNFDEETDPQVEVANIELELELERECSDDIWSVDEEVEEETETEAEVEKPSPVDFNETPTLSLESIDDLPDEVEASVETQNIESAPLDIDLVVAKLKDALMPEIERVIREEAEKNAERVAWEVIPDLAENLIKKEIKAISDSIE